MAKLTDSQIVTARAWLHDVFVWGGLIPQPKRDIPSTKYYFMYGQNNRYNHSTNDKQAAETVCEAIKLRQAESKFIMNVDRALETLAQCPFNPELHSTDSYLKTRKKPDMLARYLAWYCSTYHFYWSDANTSSYEMDTIKGTNLGAAL